MRTYLDVIDFLQKTMINLAVMIVEEGSEVPAKSGHDDSSNEKETNESKGTPAFEGADFEMGIGLVREDS